MADLNNILIIVDTILVKFFVATTNVIMRAYGGLLRLIAMLGSERY